jgi:hypothetical protein
MDVRFCMSRNHRREAQIALEGILIKIECALSQARPENSCFSLDFDLHGGRLIGSWHMDEKSTTRTNDFAVFS